MKIGDKNKSVAFIILVSVRTMSNKSFVRTTNLSRLG